MTTNTKTKKSVARKISEKPTRVYSYGVPFLSQETEKIVREQLYLGNRLRNKYVEIETDRRNKFRALRKTLSPAMEELEIKYDAINAEVSAAYTELKKLQRKDRTDAPQQAVIKDLKKRREDVWGLVKTERAKVSKQFFNEADAEFAKRKKDMIAEVEAERGEGGKKAGPYTKRTITKKIREQMVSEGWPAAWKLKDEIEHDAHEAFNTARAESKSCTGVKAAVKDAADRSFKDSMFNPRFRRFDGEGKVGSQITGVLTAEDAISCRHSRLKVELRPDVNIRGDKRSDRQAAVVRIMLEKQTFIDVPIVMHRPLPPGCEIKWVYLVSRKVGLKHRYEVQFTIESEFFIEQPRVGATGTVAINLGWRVLKDRIVIGTTFDGTNTEEISLGNSGLTTLARREDIRGTDNYYQGLISKSDDLFDGVRNEFIKFLAGDLSDWLAKNLEDESLKLDSVLKWNAHSKLVRAARKLAKDVFFSLDEAGVSNFLNEIWAGWKSYRFSGTKKEDLFDRKEVIFKWLSDNGITEKPQQIAIYLELWRRKDEHLINWARNMQRRLKANIKEVYRKKAVQLSRKYESVIVEKWNKSKTAKKPDAANDNRTPQEDNASKVRQLVGVSIFTDVLKQKFGSKYNEVSGSGISRTHYECGAVAEKTPISSKDIRCPGCGKMYDQDVSAAQHLWSRSGGESPGAAESPAPARKAKKSNDIVQLDL